MPTDPLPDVSAVKAPARLADIYRDEISFFKRVFVWSACKKGFYTRHAYEPFCKPDGQWVQKWNPYYKNGEWQHLYPALVDLLIEKHLDLERLQQTCSSAHRLAPAHWETAFWFGTMAGPKTYYHAIDLDSHDVVGWTSVPSLWRESRMGWISPWDRRNLPVVRPSLRFFMNAKLIHDNFGNRIWSFSSGNLGLAIWRMYDKPQLTSHIYDQQSTRLALAKLNIEHYPQPSTRVGSLGRCHRRPCGMDTGVIVEDQVITDPVDQIRAFMKPPKTPSFSQILEAYWLQLDQMYDRFVEVGNGLSHKSLSLPEREAIVADCRNQIRTIKEWADAGCPIDNDILGQMTEPDDWSEVACLPERTVHVLHSDTESTTPSSSHENDLATGSSPPRVFVSVDLKRIAHAGKWVQFVEFLIANGIPSEDQLFQVVSTLAKWFGFVELHGHDRSRIKTVMRQFVLTNHNGMISRLQVGNTEEVFQQVDRIVDSVMDHEDDHGLSIFENIRNNRNSGKYARVYQFEPVIMGTDEKCEDSGLPLHHSSSLPSYLICGALTPVSREEIDDNNNWKYEPDLSPLPESVIQRIRREFANAKVQIRINKTTQRYPTIDSITRFFNFLFSGRKVGVRRAGRQLLEQMGFPSNTKKKQRILKVLQRSELITKGGYRSMTASRQWTLDQWVIAEMSTSRKSDHKFNQDIAETVEVHQEGIQKLQNQNKTAKSTE